MSKKTEKLKEERLEYWKKFFENQEIFTAKKNKVWISGIIEEDFYYGFEINKEKYYRTWVKVERYSGKIDYIPIAIRDTFKDINWKEAEGRKIKIAGQLRSRNSEGEDGKSHLDLYVFVTSAQLLEEDDEFIPENIIYLNGYICKKPVFRSTPLDKKITELLLAVDRIGFESDYIPSIAWFDDAYKTADAKIGSNIKIYGRIQSRAYKKFESMKITYEVSIGKIDE